MPDPTIAGANPHQEAEELLPWYATGQLDPEERALVEAHLSSCAHCRRQLAFEHRMADEFAALSPEADAGWERLKQRLELPRAPRPNLWARVSADFSAAWQTFTRPAVAAIATAQLAFVGIAGALLFTLSQPSYQALGSAPPPASANAIVMFRGDTTEAELRKLLASNGASLVGGPTAADAYLLRVPAKTRAAVLARLQRDRHVLMAQPIDAATS